jgi:hypothetical protein
MFNDILDYGTDHSAIFATGLVFSVVIVAATAIWAYGRFHQRAMRRRESNILG